MTAPRLTKFTNGRLLRNGHLVPGDLWVDSVTGTIVSPQTAFYSQQATPEQIVDLAGKILSPGFIDVQLNGGYGLDFSLPDPDFAHRLHDTNRQIIKSGVTSYVPTITSQLPNVYSSNLPYLGPSKSRDAQSGSESLGAHLEGPFLSTSRNGIHTPSVLTVAHSFADLEAVYGSTFLNNGTVRKITAAPEVGAMNSLIPEITSRGIIFSIGHSDANLEQARAAISAGATMVTHMFNAMRPFGHRDPGIFGLLGQTTRSPKISPTASPRISRPSTPRPSAQPTSSVNSSANSSPATSTRSSIIHAPLSAKSSSSSLFESLVPALPSGKPYFGLIADLIHLSPAALSIAYHAHPQGSILVTDAMPLAGLPDGTYSWTNGESIIKQGAVLTLEKNGRIAGSAVQLIECINNFHTALGDADWAEVLEGVTLRPARMLGEDVSARKGALEVGMDADLVILDEVFQDTEDGEVAKLEVDEVWKFGVRVA